MQTTAEEGDPHLQWICHFDFVLVNDRIELASIFKLGPPAPEETWILSTSLATESSGYTEKAVFMRQGFARVLHPLVLNAWQTLAPMFPPATTNLSLVNPKCRLAILKVP